MPTPFPDGSSRERHELPPEDALARGPVWVMDGVSGVRQVTGSHATLLGGDVLAVSAGDIPVCAIRAEDVLYYETLRVLDPGGTDRFGRSLWSGLGPGDELVLVWVDSGAFD